MIGLKISFSRYDYFGLILPGLLLISTILFYIPKGFYIALVAMLESYKDLKFVFIFLIGINLIFFSYLLGTVTSGIGSWLIEGYVIKEKLKYPSYNLFNKTDSKWFKNYRKTYSTTFIDQFDKVFKSYYKDIPFEGDDKFIVCFTYVKEKCPITYSRLSIFLSIYGLYRNLTICFIIIGAILIVYLILSFNLFIIVLIILSFIFSILCFFRYLKFFRIFSDEIFRSFYMDQYDRLKNKKYDVSK